MARISRTRMTGIVGSSIVLSALFLASITFPAHSSALSCTEDTSSPLTQMQNADTVIIGTVLDSSRRQTLDNPDTLDLQTPVVHSVRVDEAVKGAEKGAQVEVYVDGTWGSIKLTPNTRYLMLLSEVEGKLTEPLCETGIIPADSGAASYVKDFDKVKDNASFLRPSSSNFKMWYLAPMIALAIGAGVLIAYRINMHSRAKR